MDLDEEIDIEGEEALALVVENAQDADRDADIRYAFEVYTAVHLADDSLVGAFTVPQGPEGATRLEFVQGEEPMAVLREGMGGHGRQVFYWRAKAVDGSGDCQSEWTQVGRFTAVRDMPATGSCACGVGDGAGSFGGGLQWLLALLAVSLCRRRRRGVARS